MSELRKKNLSPPVAEFKSDGRVVYQGHCQRCGYLIRGWQKNPPADYKPPTHCSWACAGGVQ